LVDDTKKLESPEGLQFGETVDETFHGSLGLFSAGCLGSHSLVGFLEELLSQEIVQLIRGREAMPKQIPGI
jgi:hypothetical protein